MIRIQTAALCAALAGASAPLAQAGTTFTSRAAFQSGAASSFIPLDSESFEGFVSDDSAFFASLDADGFTVESVDTDFDFIDPITVQGSFSGVSPTDGSNLLSISSFGPTVTSFTFDAPNNAVGFDLVDILDFGGGDLTVAFDNGDAFTIASGSLASGNGQFFGYIGDAFTTMVVENTDTGDQYGYDLIEYGAVPSPGGLALLGMGGLLGVRRRR